MNTLSNTQKAVYGVKIQNKFDYGIAGGGGVELEQRKPVASSLKAVTTLRCLTFTAPQRKTISPVQRMEQLP